MAEAVERVMFRERSKGGSVWLEPTRDGLAVSHGYGWFRLTAAEWEAFKAEGDRLTAGRQCLCAAAGTGAVRVGHCPVHGTPGPKGEPCTARSAILGHACDQPAAALVSGTCEFGHVAERHLCAAHAEPEEPLWCMACYAVDGSIREITLTIPGAAQAVGTEAGK